MSWAPGRVNLIGEHTDYSGGLALPVAIQLGLRLDVDSPADTVTLTSDRFDGRAEFAADGRGASAQGWARLAQAVAAELDELGRPAVGFTGRLSSSLPVGAGLSSSAALEVAVALALCAVSEFEVEPLALVRACQRAESAAVGVPCGVLDQFACVHGAAGSALLLDCATLTAREVPIPPGATFLIIDSGVRRRLEDSQYGQRRAELERALASVDSDPVSPRRLRHVVSENERVTDFAAALELDDLESAGELISESHRSLRDDYEVSTPELDALVDLAVRSGALGARLVGGGFGGSVLALVEAGRAEAVRRALGREALVVEPSAGAHQ